MEQAADFSSLGYFWAAVLGVVQGLTEFLPISSSGHLALVEHLGMGMAVNPMFDVLLHFATLLVVIAYFRRSMLWYYRNDIKVLVYVVAASVPTGVIGLVCKKYFEALRISPGMVCVGLLITACALFVADFRKDASYQLRDLGWFGAFVIGVCQALALAPGISRSGITIAGTMHCGIDRNEAFRFSFILSVPAVLGAVILHAIEMIRGGDFSGFLGNIPFGPFAVGFALAVFTGYLTLMVLERLVSGGRLVWFAVYCCLAGGAGLVYFNLLA